MNTQTVTSLELIEELARQRERINWRFRSYVKARLAMSDEVLDEHVRDTSLSVAAQIDCTQCANCCKVLQPVVDAEDLDRLAGRLGISQGEFESRYVMREEFGEMCLNISPCPFLKDNLCSVYEDRPKACRDFPYLQSEGFRQRMIAVIENSARCPIVFNTLEELKRSTAFLAQVRRTRRKGSKVRTEGGTQSV